MRWLILALALATACGGEATPGANPTSRVPENVTGLITEVTFEADEVVSFVVEARGHTYDLLIDRDYEYGFNLKHLEKHRVQELPVHVEISARDGTLYAHEVLDA